MKLATPVAVAAVLSLAACADSAAPISGIAHTAGAPLAALTPLDGEVVMDGLYNPRGLAFGPDGALFVAEAGRGGDGDCFLVVNQSQCYGPTGSVSRLRDGVQERVIDGLPSMAAVNGQGQGPDGLSITGYGQAYLSIGLEGNPSLRTGGLAGMARIVHLSATALRGNARGHGPDEWEFVADVGNYELDADPDCGRPDTDPFGLLADGGDLLIADAGGNSLLRLDATGELSTFLAMQSRYTQPRHEGCPLPLGYPAVQPQETVPTSIVKGIDGAYYIGQLKGVPITAGLASIFRYVPGGEPEPWATGFTYIVAMTRDPAGNLYVVQYTDGVVAGTQLPGSVIRVAPDGTRETVVSGIKFPTGVAFGPDGALYVTQYGNKTRMTPLGEVLRFTL